MSLFSWAWMSMDSFWHSTHIAFPGINLPWSVMGSVTAAWPCVLRAPQCWFLWRCWLICFKDTHHDPRWVTVAQSAACCFLPSELWTWSVAECRLHYLPGQLVQHCLMREIIFFARGRKPFITFGTCAVVKDKLWPVSWGSLARSIYRVVANRVKAKI